MTKRTALVSVRNNTDSTIVGVSVVHKYSDNYTNDKQWGIIQSGELAGDQLEVEYNTGAFTTGRDWWVLTWYNLDMTTLYYSDPDNFRGIIDSLEEIAPDSIAAAAGAIAGLAGSLTGPGAVAAAVGAAAVAKTTTSALFNSEATDGFKQHILREEDEDALTEIVINSDRTITFKSNSGNSDTVSSEKPVEN
ncbi:Fc.00g012110.m01.CDS01 [Cosmosporella sp. VM-42]